MSYALFNHPRWMGHDECSDKLRFSGEGNGKTLQYSCLENPMNNMKKAQRYDTERQTPRLVVAQYEE